MQPKLISLGLDTSTSYCGISIVSGTDTLIEINENIGKKHAETLMVLTERALDTAQLDWIGLEPKIGFISAAIATSTAGWSMLLLLWFGTRKFKGALKFDSNFYKKILTIIIASAIMGICILLSNWW